MTNVENIALGIAVLIGGAIFVSLICHFPPLYSSREKFLRISSQGKPMQVLIGTAEVVSNIQALSAHWLVTPVSVEGEPVDATIATVLSYSGNSLTADNPSFKTALKMLGLFSLFFNETDGLCKNDTVMRATPIVPWMQTRVAAAATAYVAAHPAPADRSPEAIAKALVEWLDFWFAYAIDNPPSALYWVAG